MKRQPDAMFVLDLRKEALAVREARRLGLPIVALVDTNCDPDEADYVIPGNDDAIRSCSLIVRVIAAAIEQGKTKVSSAEMAAPREAAPEPEAEAPQAVEAPAESAASAAEEPEPEPPAPELPASEADEVEA
jgi:small subunit ribosomal protein S2